MSVTLDERSRPPDTYLDFVRRHSAPPKRRPPVRRPGGAGPLGDPVLQAILGLIGHNSGPAQLTDDQIRAKAAADAQAIIGPLIDREQNNYMARLGAGASAISGYTGTFADRVGALGPQVQQLFAGDQSLAGAFGNKLGDVQGDANMANVHSLADALKQMGAPNAKDTVGQQKALSAGGTRVTKTLTADELERLSTEGGAGAEFMGKMPGIAALTGGQYLRDYSTSLNNALGDNLSEINSSLPGLVRQLVGDYTSRNTDAANTAAQLGLSKAQLAAAIYGSNQDRALNASIFDTKTKLAYDQLNATYQIKLANAKTSAGKAAVDAWYKKEKLLIDQQNANSATTSANASATRAAQAGAPKPVTWRSVVDDARKSAAAFADVGQLGQKTRPPWQKAYNQLYRYIRAKYQKLTPDQVRTATINGLYGAGYSPKGGGAPAAAGPVLPTGP